MRVDRAIAIGVTLCLGITILVVTGVAMPWIVREMVHPTGSFAGPINRYVARVCVTAIALASGVEGLLLGVLLRHGWMRRSWGKPAMVICGAIAALALLALGILQR